MPVSLSMQCVTVHVLFVVSHLDCMYGPARLYCHGKQCYIMHVPANHGMSSRGSSDASDVRMLFHSHEHFPHVVVPAI